MAIQTVKTGAAVNDGTGDDARTAFTKINQNFTDSSHAASRLVGTSTGNVMEVGAFGLGVQGYPISAPNIKNKSMFFMATPDSEFPEWMSGISMGLTPNESWQLCKGTAQYSTPVFRGTYYNGTGFVMGNWFKFWTQLNTTVDSNGFIKGASPIVKLFANKIELNDEAKLQDITFEKLGVGDYLVKGSTGFAQEGWYIEMPKDANGNVLVAVVYEQLANNDISVKTYDYMLNKKGRIVPDLETPLDIPSTRWIDLRLQALPQEDIQPLSTDEMVNANAE